MDVSEVLKIANFNLRFAFLQNKSPLPMGRGPRGEAVGIG
jgi:hypothetical protein